MQVGRNDPCFCGSGKKYKKCCFQKSQPISGLERLKNVKKISNASTLMNLFPKPPVIDTKSEGQSPEHVSGAKETVQAK